MEKWKSIGMKLCNVILPKKGRVAQKKPYTQQQVIMKDETRTLLDIVMYRIGKPVAITLSTKMAR